MNRIEAQFPNIPRAQLQDKIVSVLNQAADRRQSAAILLYGAGGVGKTYFLREMPSRLPPERFVWLGPYDVDDAEFWLLSNLESKVAAAIDPENRFFAPYFDYQSRIPTIEAQSAETLLAYSRQGEKLFFECYERCVTESQCTPILSFDTFEAIRGLDLLPRLVRWMKRLAGTVFILASRPGPSDKDDAVITALEATPAVSAEVIAVRRFVEAESRAFLDASPVASEMTEAHIRAAMELANGYPLWLAMITNYLAHYGVPSELTAWAEADEDVRIELQDDFLRRLIVPYRGSDFWSLAIKRLGVVRRRVSQPLWVALMQDRNLPPDVDGWEAAWAKLISLPWIRTRANRRYITLHDAVAEALATRVIPLDDANRQWRREQWRRAANTYDVLVKERAESPQAARAEFERALQEKRSIPEALVTEVVQQTVHITEYYLLLSTAFYYRMLSEREAGLKQFVALFDACYLTYGYRLIELLWVELQHFLSQDGAYDPLDDIVKPEIVAFQAWYAGEQEYRFQIESRIARYLVYRGRPADALVWLDRLYDSCRASDERAFQILRMRGDARFRTAGNARLAGEDYAEARRLAEDPQASEKVRAQLNEALLEQAYYYRNIGQWREATRFYRLALEATPMTNREASGRIQAQYAYVMALRGREEAQEKVTTALKIGRKLNDPQLTAMALSIKGEVWRYWRLYDESYEANRESEEIFMELDRNPWLGVVRQQVAICLYQAARARQLVGRYVDLQAMQREAESAVEQAIRTCRDYHMRSLPMALNRGGSIFWEVNPQRSLKHLTNGIAVAQEVADTWMYVANLVELATLSFEQWRRTGESSYRETIHKRQAQAEAAFAELEEGAFLELRGRWQVITGHCLLAEGLERGDTNARRRQFDAALSKYSQGYLDIARGYASGRTYGMLQHMAASMLDLMRELGSAEIDRWLEELDGAWKRLGEGDKACVGPLTTLLGDLDLELRL